MNFENIKSDVDFDEEKAFVSFELNGNKYYYDLKVNDDWVDDELFTQISNLIEEYKTNGRLTYFSTGGQDLVLGWATNEEL